jgi:hypothetical protein
MKISLKRGFSQLIAGLFTVVIAILSASAARAQTFLLEIDDSNPAATVITAVPLNTASGSTSGTYDLQNGVDLLGFFTSNIGTYPYLLPTTPSSLTTGDASSGPIFNEGLPDNLSGQEIDLSLFQLDSTQQISFTSGQTAFDGSLTLNLTSVEGFLPNADSARTSGSIVTGYNGAAPNTPIGEWKLVTPVTAPEPSTWALLLGSIALLPLARRFRRA